MPEIIFNEYDQEQRLVDSFTGWVIGVTLPEPQGLLYGRTVDVFVQCAGSDSDGFTTVKGYVFDPADDLRTDQPFEWRYDDIDRIEVY